MFCLRVGNLVHWKCYWQIVYHEQVAPIVENKKRTLTIIRFTELYQQTRLEFWDVLPSVFFNDVRGR